MSATMSPQARLLVVGQNSFLARHFREACPAGRFVGHDAIGRPDLLDGVDRVISFARHPLLGQEGYRPAEMDPDLCLAARIGDRPIAYVMLSSRKVYAPGPGPLGEGDPTVPQDRYGEHKLAVEQQLRARLGARLTVLRLANVFGYERGPERRTFLSLTLDQLARDGHVHFDMSPLVERDFLPVEGCARLLAQIVAQPPGGVLNLGSGIALATGRIALWVIEGFGRGQLVIDSPREHDPFVLDVGRLQSLYGTPCTIDDLRESCLAIGRRLAAEIA